MTGLLVACVLGALVALWVTTRELGRAVAGTLAVTWGVTVWLVVATAAGTGGPGWAEALGVTMLLAVVTCVVAITRALGLTAGASAIGLLGAAWVVALVWLGPATAGPTVVWAGGIQGCSTASGPGSVRYPSIQPKPNAQGPSAAQIATAPGCRGRGGPCGGQDGSNLATTAPSLGQVLPQARPRGALVPPSSPAGAGSIPIEDCTQWIQRAATRVRGGDGTWGRIPLGEPLG